MVIQAEWEIGMKSMLITMLVFYVGSCLVLYLLQRKFLYYPQPAAVVRGVAEVSFDTDGEQLRGWLVNEGRPKALVYYGGNAENIEDNITLFKTALPDYTVYLIPYRGYGNSTGYPTEAFLYSDALAIFDRVKDKHEQISLIGRSLGTGVATYVAANRQIEKLLLVTPFDSIVNVAKSVYWMFPVSLLIHDKFDSLNRVNKINAQTYIFIAEEDRVIPRVRTERLIAQFTDQLKGTILVTGAAHNDISQYPEYTAGLKRALE
jgi:pimeloyl-ACP methyl ester carboxylesterase